jgi:hypothetical protein
MLPEVRFQHTKVVEAGGGFGVEGMLIICRITRLLSRTLGILEAYFIVLKTNSMFPFTLENRWAATL